MSEIKNYYYYYYCYIINQNTINIDNLSFNNHLKLILNETI